MKKYVRPSWDEYFMEMVETVGKRATCSRGRSGCVIVKDHEVLATGYVGSPAGLPHCDDVGHLIEQTMHVGDDAPKDHCVRTVHAEQNAIAQAAKNGKALKGASLYCTMTPCRTCAMMIINCGIKEVVCENRYQTSSISEDLFNQAGVSIIYTNGKDQEYE